MPDTDSRAREIMNYSFLVAFANDGILDSRELEFMKKLALKDGKVDDEERKVLSAVFERANKHNLDENTAAEIKEFRSKYEI